eukprot:9418299-Pyramimonas_sp.AAC.1
MLQNSVALSLQAAYNCNSNFSISEPASRASCEVVLYKRGPDLLPLLWPRGRLRLGGMAGRTLNRARSYG